MAALTSARNTQQKGDAESTALGVEANGVVYVGSMVAVDDNGLALPAQAKSGSAPLTKVPYIMGVMNNVVSGDIGQDAHNVAGYPMIPSPPSLGAAGAISVRVLRGVFKMDNDGTIVQASVGQFCFAQDDHTVGLGDGSGTTTVTAAAYTTPAAGILTQPLGHENIVQGSVLVQNSGQTTTYVEGTDYAIDYQSGIIEYLSGGAIAGGAVSLKIGFKWQSTSPTLGCAGTVLALEPDGVWVDFRTKGVVAA